MRQFGSFFAKTARFLSIHPDELTCANMALPASPLSRNRVSSPEGIPPQTG
jgi:hypothetical protein